MSDTATFTAAVVAFFKARPGVWVPATALETVGGRQAWRTRVSDARRLHGMTIENRTRRITRTDGETWRLSEYRYLAPVVAPLGGATQVGLPL